MTDPPATAGGTDCVQAGSTDFLGKENPTKQSRGVHMITSTLQDLRYSLRALLKHRNFTAAALLTLALGIGINTSIFTLLYSVAFRPLPVKEPERVVNIYQVLDGKYSRQVKGKVLFLSART